VEQLQRSFDESVDLLLKAYERYLEDMIPAPSFLPITVAVFIATKNITLKKVILKPTDSAKDLKEMIQKKLMEMGDPLMSYNEDNIFVVKDHSSGAEKVIEDEQRPLREYNIVHGDTFTLQGVLKLKSDQPKQCFSTTFDKSKNMVMDYFTCKDCKFNWICKPCTETCHKGHAISEYISNHRPTWGCCYCVKNKKCKIVDNKK